MVYRNKETRVWGQIVLHYIVVELQVESLKVFYRRQIWIKRFSFANQKVINCDKISWTKTNQWFSEGKARLIKIIKKQW